jgi:SAM-dependent methyltransferase
MSLVAIAEKCLDAFRRGRAREEEPAPPPPPGAPALPPVGEPLRYLNRFILGRMYLKGNGIEVGALHNPMDVPPESRVRYVDRLPVEELRRHYPELDGQTLARVDILDDGAELSSIPDASQDFVVANGVLEHYPNPLKALRNMFRVLKEDGVLFMALPDKTITFDRDRPVTPFAHLMEDLDATPDHRKRQHFGEWVRLVNKVEEPEAVERKTEELLAIDYSIHYHVWTELEILELLVEVKKRLKLPYRIELIYRIGYGFDVVLRKKTSESNP